MAEMLSDLQALAGLLLLPASLIGSGVALAAIALVSLLDALQELSD